MEELWSGSHRRNKLTATTSGEDSSMLANPDRSEIDQHTGKLIVGLIAIFLASVTNTLADGGLDSISEAYHRGGTARDVFVGSLLAISAFLAAYNGHSGTQKILSKVAAVAAIGIAMVPCLCPQYSDPKSSWVHGVSAGILFLTLAYFCYTFFERAREKKYPLAELRAWIYAFCGLIITLVVIILGYDYFSDRALSTKFDRLIFYGEKAGLIFFGIAWLTASRLSPFVTIKDELPSCENQTEEAT